MHSRHMLNADNLQVVTIHTLFLQTAALWLLFNNSSHQDSTWILMCVFHMHGLKKCN
jgi:hypothetical protein